MNTLIKDVNKHIKPESINFSELVKNSNTTLTLDFQSKLIELLNQEFTEEESQFYIASFIMYLNYHPTNDFPVNLEHVFKKIGFANKGNAMKTIKSNFTLDEDYKTIIFPTEKNKSTQETRGRKEETILLNVDTLKNLFLIAKTPEGKKARKYFIKIENMNHKMLKMEMDEQKHLVDTFHQEKKQIQNETKSNMLIEQYKDKRIVYLGIVKEMPEYNIIKYGCTKQVKDTLSRHRNTYGNSFNYIYMTECQKHDELERKIQTHNDLVSRHVKEFDGNARNELLRIETSFNLDKLIILIESLKESMENKLSIQLELARELTKQKEIDMKQKELEINLELKKLDFELEMFRLKSNSNNINDNIKDIQVIHVIKEYFDKYTIYSNNNLDTIKMSDLYKKFVEWLKIEHVDKMFSQRQFTNKFNQLKIGKYDMKISNLNGNSGIRNRKFKLV